MNLNLNANPNLNLNNAQMLALLGLVWSVGLIAATQVNRGIYRLAWNARCIGPWVPRDCGARRRASDFLPIVGWWFLRRESPEHGRGYWMRPLLVELFLPLAFCWLFLWEVGGGLWPVLPGLGEPVSQTVVRWLAHCVLIALMTVATFVDIDEQTIPDWITIPGTLLALIWMTVSPSSLPPDASAAGLRPLWLTAPNDWSPDLDASAGWWLAIACWSVWIYGLLPKTWFTRYGLRRALRFLVVSIGRHPWNRWFALLWVVGLVAITGVWWKGGLAWQGLLSSLTGLAYGGGMVWAVRIVGAAVLKREAMGFGDVTLMAMIGAFLGWQPALVVFFLAPFAGAVLALVQRWVFGREDIPYGPFLCAATVLLLLSWGSFWFAPGPGQLIFSLGGIINVVLMICLALLAVLLLAWQAIRTVLLPRPQARASTGQRK